MKIFSFVFLLWLALTDAARRNTDLDGFHPKFINKVQKESTGEEDNSFWEEKAQATLTQKSEGRLNYNIAKNVIMFLGDGMSIPTLAAARIYKAQISGKRSGEGEFLSFEKFPYSGLSRTYCVDRQTADSACSATAYLGGVKGNYGTIGVNGRVLRGDCEASRNMSNHVHSIAKWAVKAGKAAGVVTTTRVTHASPAGTYANVAERDWENDADVQDSDQDPEVCDDIAEQLIYNLPGKEFKVILGGGLKNFLPKNVTDPVLGKGDRVDGKNLIEAWKKDKELKDSTYEFVYNRTQLLSLKEPPDYLLGLFNRDHLEFHLKNKTEEPTLEEMTENAIKVLEQSENGFFLFVEGGKIDTAHHENHAHISLDETVEFSKAIAKAVSLTNENDTLIVVTSDHAHTMSVSGYASRSASIFGFGGTADDKMPYNILTYANGPGYKKPNPDGSRPNPEDEDTEKYDYLSPTTTPLGYETHGSDDVGVFANGPWSHLFTGSIEENYIPHAMGYASCLGDGKTACLDRK